MSTRRERRERSRLHGVCRNCGEKGRHYAPPGFGSPGMFICEKKEAPMGDRKTAVDQEVQANRDELIPQIAGLEDLIEEKS